MLTVNSYRGKTTSHTHGIKRYTHTETRALLLGEVTNENMFSTIGLKYIKHVLYPPTEWNQSEAKNSEPVPITHYAT